MDPLDNTCDVSDPVRGRCKSPRAFILTTADLQEHICKTDVCAGHMAQMRTMTDRYCTACRAAGARDDRIRVIRVDPAPENFRARADALRDKLGLQDRMDGIFKDG